MKPVEVSTLVREVFGLDAYGNPIQNPPPAEVANARAVEAARPRRDEPILLVINANPVSTTALQLARETRLILDELRSSHALRVEVRPAALFEDLSTYLIETTPTVLHFAGHGSPDGIVLEDREGGLGVVRTATLARMLAIQSIRQSLRVVVLNSCWSESQALAIKPFVDAVVGMSHDVPDRVAMAFAQGFYRGVANGLSVKDATELGRVQVEIMDAGPAAVPQLVTKMTDGAASVFVLTR